MILILIFLLLHDYARNAIDFFLCISRLYRIVDPTPTMTSSEDVKKYALVIERGLKNHVFCDAASKRQSLASSTELHQNCRDGSKVMNTHKNADLSWLHYSACLKSSCIVRYRFTQCKVCVRLYMLAYLHAKSCTRDNCSLLYCDEVRATLKEEETKFKLAKTDPLPSITTTRE